MSGDNNGEWYSETSQRDTDRKNRLPLAAAWHAEPSAQFRFFSSCMDLPAIMICFRTGLRKDTMVCCRLEEPWSLPELALALSLIFSSFSVFSDTLYSVYVAYQKSLWFTGTFLFLWRFKRILSVNLCSFKTTVYFVLV